MIISPLMISLPAIKTWSFSRQATFVWKENVLERSTAGLLCLCVCVLFPSMCLAGRAVQSKHRFSAPENMRLGSAAKARQTSLGQEEAGLLSADLTRPPRGRGCSSRAGPPLWVRPPTGSPITCAVSSLFWSGLG